jgi:hypothetical protein
MNNKFTPNALLILGTFFCSSLALADTPTTLEEHSHGVTISGKLTFFRAQAKGIELGPANDRLDAEALVGVEGYPDKVFGVHLHEAEPSATEMIATLREAYLRKIPVTLSVPMIPVKNNLTIYWVQLGKPGKK